jgi:hypothetical protein
MPAMPASISALLPSDGSRTTDLHRLPRGCPVVARTAAWGRDRKATIQYLEDRQRAGRRRGALGPGSRADALGRDDSDARQLLYPQPRSGNSCGVPPGSATVRPSSDK